MPKINERGVASNASDATVTAPVAQGLAAAVEPETPELVPHEEAPAVRAPQRGRRASR